MSSLGNYFFANTLTVTRWSLVILYFFVVLHKLNFDFFDPYASCGAVLFEEIFQRSGVFSIGTVRDFYYAHEITFKVSSIYFSLIAEAIIPILLMVKRWRNAGIVFAIIFHFLLSLHGHNGIFSFSAMLFTLFTFFWSDGVINHFYSIWDKKHKWIAYATICGLGILISVNFSLPYFYYVLACLIAWFIYAVLYSSIFFKAVYRHYADTEFTFVGKRKVWITWAIPVLIIVNGLCPYLGLKTETSFSMFSNLRTEGNQTNHFFIPTSWQIFDYQKELVLIKKSNYSRLQHLDLYHGQVDVRMVKWEFIKILNYAPENSFVDYEINGKPGYFEKVNGKITASELDLHMSPVLNKIFDFRLVHSDKSLCKH